MSNFNTIKDLWEEFQKQPFPPSISDKEIFEIDPAGLDTFTTGCISRFILNQGKLGLWRCAILGLCFHDIAILNIELEGEGKEYFLRLEELVRMILEEVRDVNKEES